MPARKIPDVVMAEVSAVLGAHYYSHSRLNILFKRNGAPGDPPAGNCVDKCFEWLRLTNEGESSDAFALLGGVLQEFMELQAGDGNTDWQEKRERVREALAKYGLSYQHGGRIIGADVGVPTRSLEAILRARDFAAIEGEFNRALGSVESDPPAAITAASSIIESLCKTYIQDNGLTMPSDQSIKPLWRVVQGKLGLQPSSVADGDIVRLLGALSGIVDAVGALRTHVGSAHGRGRDAHPLTGKHARLAIHSAHTLTTFVLETWNELSPAPSRG